MIRAGMRSALRIPARVPVPFALSATQRLQYLLFGEGQQGVMYVPQPTVDNERVLYQYAAGTTPVLSDGDPVLYQGDVSHNSSPATSSIADQTYRIDGAVSYIDHTSGSLSVQLPDLGTSATVVTATWDGVSYLEGQTISGSFTLPSAKYELVIIVDYALSPEQKSKIEQYHKSIWLLSVGVWSDAGIWRDIAIWEDAA